MTIRDSAQDSAAAAGDVLELCKMVNEFSGRWTSLALGPLVDCYFVGDVLREDWSVRNGRESDCVCNLLHGRKSTRRAIH